VGSLAAGVAGLLALPGGALSCGADGTIKLHRSPACYALMQVFIHFDTTHQGLHRLWGRGLGSSLEELL
jgi:hypothetical protein